MEDLDRRIETLVLWMAEAERLVVFTGAGISTDSGLPDFRGPDGLWTRQEKGLPPKDPKLDWTKTSPNEAHHAIVGLQKMGKLDFLVSQNIDDLHRRSGIRPEILAELHGNLARVRCVDCEETYPRSDALERCPCGGALKSSVVGFGDSLPTRDLSDSFEHARRCDLLIVIGSSLVVTPAATVPGSRSRRGRGWSSSIGARRPWMAPPTSASRRRSERSFHRRSADSRRGSELAPVRDVCLPELMEKGR